MPQPEANDLAAILRFYSEAGVTDALTDAPANRFLASAAKAPAQAMAPKAAPSPLPAAAISAAVPDGAQAARAAELAAAAPDLEALKACLAAFDGCNLKFTAKQLVFGEGDPAARLMLVGEAPGADEDREGRPFVGRSGQLLDKILAAIGIERQAAFIANSVYWRPPGNRTPTPMETEICRPFLERQIALIKPDVLVALGAPAARALTGSSEGILRLRGIWSTFKSADGRDIAVMPTLHPAYLLRNPGHKKLAWRDFLDVKMRLAKPAI